MRKFSQLRTTYSWSLLLTGFCLLGLGSSNWSCRDTSPNLNQNQGNPANEIGLLRFKDAKTYEGLISLHAQRDKKAFDAALSQTEGYAEMIALLSGSRNAANDDIKSEFLRRILNKDGAVQIDKWIIKVDPKRGQCRVILVKNYSQSLYHKMINNVADPLIYSFADNYDVLDLLKEGYTSVPNIAPNGRIALFCGGGIGSRSPNFLSNNSYDHQYTDGNGNTQSASIRFGARIEYSKYGIYFECDFHLENFYTSSPVPQINNTFNVQYTCNSYCRTNCQNYWEFSCNITNDPLWLDESDHSGWNDQNGYDFMRHRLYQGSRGLKCLRALTKYSISLDQNPNASPEVITVEVVDAGCQP